MELYEQIRREYEFGAGSIIGVGRKLGVHRRMVREAVRSATPARRKKTERPHLKIAPAAAFIDAVLVADRKAPRKQRYTAKTHLGTYPFGGAGMHGSRADGSSVRRAA